jgi:hypothetical protein
MYKVGDESVDSVTFLRLKPVYPPILELEPVKLAPAKSMGSKLYFVHCFT